jgi:hypothetical protein
MIRRNSKRFISKIENTFGEIKARLKVKLTLKVL